MSERLTEDEKTVLRQRYRGPGYLRPGVSDIERCLDALDAVEAERDALRADLQEARALLMTAMDLAKEGANLVREPKPAPKPWSREAEFKGRVGYNGEDCRAFLARTSPKEERDE